MNRLNYLLSCPIYQCHAIHKEKREIKVYSNRFRIFVDYVGFASYMFDLRHQDGRKMVKLPPNYMFNP